MQIRPETHEVYLLHNLFSTYILIGIHMKSWNPLEIRFRVDTQIRSLAAFRYLFRIIFSHAKSTSSVTCSRRRLEAANSCG